MFRVYIDLDVKIDGCPDDGIDAVRFRQAHKIAPEPRGSIKLKCELDSEELSNRFCGLLNYQADLYLAGSGPVSNAAYKVLRPRRYSAGRDATPTASPAVLAAFDPANPETVAALIAELLMRSAVWIAAEAEQDRAEKEAKAAKHETTVKGWLDGSIDRFLRTYEGKWILKSFSGYYEADDERAFADPRLANRIADAKAEAERRNIEEAAKLESGRTALAAWAVANGSDLLRARLAHEFEWVKLAEAEFARHVADQLGLGEPLPEEDADVKDRSTPTLAEIRTLETVEAAIKVRGLPATADLVWVVYPEGEESDYQDGEASRLKRCEIRIDVTCPTGEERSLFYLPATASLAEATTA